MKFIVIEGLDGAGKSTQIKLIEDYLRVRNIKSKFLHFPRTDSPIYGELVSKFLRGELGEIDQVNPYLVALIYAGDRKDAADDLVKWMDEGNVIISDRYLYSNIAFQCAKIQAGNERDKLARWIKEFEYEYNKIPIPDLNLFLNVPFNFTQRSLRSSRKGGDRDYLQGATDIHEADLSFQQKVRDVYLWQVEQNEDFQLVECSDERGEMLKPDQISKSIIHRIQEKLSVNQL